MKGRTSLCLAVAIGVLQASVRAADIGTAFTYQGSLENPPGTAVSDTCTFEFALCDDAVAACVPGTISSHPGIVVSGGVFTVPNIDFGADAINGTARWLRITINCGNPGDPITLTQRVELKPAPHALALPGLYTQQNAISPNLIGGYNGNTVTGGAYGATIGGGGYDGRINSVTTAFGTIGGGEGNTTSGEASTVGGGYDNNCAGNSSTIAGGGSNRVDAHVATIGGGSSNMVFDDYGTISGGRQNQASGQLSVIGGGQSNVTTDDNCTVGGGGGNVAGDGSPLVHNDFATIGGGESNTASGTYSVVPGGLSNEAGGDYSFAAGRQAHVRSTDLGDAATDNGTFIWADSTAADFSSTGSNQFLIRAAGGVGINNNSPLFPTLQVGTFGDFTNGNGAYVDPGGFWVDTCDRNAKENFEHFDRQALLERLTDLPITRWNFKGQEESITHIGPVAQDFHAAFGTGRDDKHLAALDTAGVALAAIQGLYEIVQEKDCEIENLRDQIADFKELEARLTRLEALLHSTSTQGQKP